MSTALRGNFATFRPLATMAHKKLTLPSKPCLECGRPFSWRKKWAKDWEQVRYCSDRCRGKRPPEGRRGVQP